MRLLPTLALGAALMTGACTNPDGSLNVPATLAVGAGAAIAGVAIASASNDDGRRHRGYHRGGGRGHNYGYDRGYRREAYGYGGYGHPHYRRW